MYYMTIPEESVKILDIEPEYQNIEKGYKLALESNDVDFIKTVLKEMHTHFGFAVIRSYVGKFMEQERLETINKPSLFDLYCKRYTKNCDEAINIFMKDDEEYQAYLRRNR